ncbi:hypothetical protein SLE2022_153520 [Rubroshorea leprosula]
MWSLYSDIAGAVDESVQEGGCSKHSSKCANGKEENDDKERSANVESKNEMVDDVELENGRERDSRRLDGQEKKATARQKSFEFQNVENSLMSDEEVFKQSDNKCKAAGIGNTQEPLINTQGETAEEFGYVPDSLCEHLMQCQEHDLKRGKGDLSGPTNPSPSKKQRGERDLGPDHQAGLEAGDIWATNGGPGAAKKKKVSKVKSAEVERGKSDDTCEKEGEKQGGDGSSVGMEVHSEAQSFWQGFESESGQVKAWMGRSERKSKKQRRKRIRSCSYVYQKSRRGECPGMETEQSRSRKAREIEFKMPKFNPDSHDKAAEDSITDSGIENRNRCLRDEAKSGTGKQIWGFAKLIGVVDRGNEEEVLRRLEAMEERDRETYRRSVIGEAENGGNRSADLL